MILAGDSEQCWHKVNSKSAFNFSGNFLLLSVKHCREDHLDCDVDEIEKLALVKKHSQNLDENDFFDGETFFNQLDSE